MQILVSALPGAKKLNFMQLIEAVDDFLADSEDRLIREHEEIVENWETPPSFESRVHLGNTATIFVWPTGNEEGVKHWHWVSRGTRARPIYPTGHPSSPNYVPPIYDAKGRWRGGGKTVLRYTHTYIPRTGGKGPGFTSGGAGQYVGERVEASSEPNYPGIAARHFEEGLRSRANLWWGVGMRKAIEKAASELGG